MCFSPEHFIMYFERRYIFCLLEFHLLIHIQYSYLIYKSMYTILGNQKTHLVCFYHVLTCISCMGNWFVVYTRHRKKTIYLLTCIYNIKPNHLCVVPWVGNTYCSVLVGSKNKLTWWYLEHFQSNGKTWTITIVTNITLRQYRPFCFKSPLVS